MKVEKPQKWIPFSKDLVAVLLGTGEWFAKSQERFEKANCLECKNKVCKKHV